MHLEEINDRLELLFNVLYYCSYYSNELTIGQKICINQECGSLLEKKAFLFQIITNLEEVRDYKVTSEIETKIQSIQHKIRSLKYFEHPSRFC